MKETGRSEGKEEKLGNWGTWGGYVLVEFFGGRRKALGLTHSTDEAKKGTSSSLETVGEHIMFRRVREGS